MKLIIFLPFVSKTIFDLKWLPISTPILVGNLKKLFPKIIFNQVDLSEEIKKIFSKDFCLDLSSRVANITDINSTSDDLSKFEDFFDDIVNHLKLKEYDHYLFSHYNTNKLGIKANILLAKYLKRRYKNKKIIFGGIYGFGKDYSKVSFEELDFIDSSVVGYGERSTKKIITNLLNNKKIKKVYSEDIPYKDVLENLPDYRSFRNFKNFRYSTNDFRRIYNIRLDEAKRSKKIVFIPYKFSIGCFWHKCAYCRQSYCVNDSHSPAIYHKEIDQIIKDLVKLKKTYKTKYFIFLSNNFNFDLDFSKKLLNSFIKNRLNILWTDSFNLRILDEEIIDLLAKAGCFAMDIGVTTLNPKIQKLYNNILQDNSYLKNLKKISDKGIWTNINLIVNLPHQYSIKKDKTILKKYIKHIDGVYLNNYRRTPETDLTINQKKYNLKYIFEEFSKFNKIFYLYYIENDFPGTLEKRKKMFAKNWIEMDNFFKSYKKFSNTVNHGHIHLLGYLYNRFGFENKDKIKDIIINMDDSFKKNIQ